MNATDAKVMCEFTHARWPDNTISDELWRDFGERLQRHPPLPLPRAKEIVGEFRWKAKTYRNPDLPELERALALEARVVAANVARQNAGLEANRAALHERPEDIAAEHEAAREFVRVTPLEELHRLRDRCRSRGSKFVRCLMDNLTPIESKIIGGGTTAKVVEKPAQVVPLDWSSRDAILDRLWVCMGLAMEHNGLNDWSPIGTGEGVGA